jgi:(p)ppGpp synthase/HD superfamily hydrolase
VASLALEYGASKDTAIAALLNDAGEEQGGTLTLEAIDKRFGDNVLCFLCFKQARLQSKKTLAAGEHKVCKRPNLMAQDPATPALVGSRRLL